MVTPRDDSDQGKLLHISRAVEEWETLVRRERQQQSSGVNSKTTRQVSMAYQIVTTHLRSILNGQEGPLRMLSEHDSLSLAPTVVGYIVAGPEGGRLRRGVGPVVQPRARRGPEDPRLPEVVGRAVRARVGPRVRNRGLRPPVRYRSQRRRGAAPHRTPGGTGQSSRTSEVKVDLRRVREGDRIGDRTVASNVVERRADAGTSTYDVHVITFDVGSVIEVHGLGSPFHDVDPVVVRVRRRTAKPEGARR